MLSRETYLPNFDALFSRSHDVGLRIFDGAQLAAVAIESHKGTIGVWDLAERMCEGLDTITAMGRRENLHVVILRCLQDHAPEGGLDGMVDSVLGLVNQ